MTERKCSDVPALDARCLSRVERLVLILAVLGPMYLVWVTTHLLAEHQQQHVVPIVYGDGGGIPSVAQWFFALVPFFTACCILAGVWGACLVASKSSRSFSLLGGACICVNVTVAWVVLSAIAFHEMNVLGVLRYVQDARG